MHAALKTTPGLKPEEFYWVFFSYMKEISKQAFVSPGEGKTINHRGMFGWGPRIK